MKRINRMNLWMIAAIPLLIGCVDDPDHRLANMAERNLSTQARQNEQMAQQNQLVVEASRDLVQADALARKEIVAAQAKFQAAIQTDRATINQQRDALELERRAIAVARQREPIIAATVSSFGLLLACLLPLVLAGYILYCANQPDQEQAGLSDLLITELVAEHPKLLPPAHNARHIEQRNNS